MTVRLSAALSCALVLSLSVACGDADDAPGAVDAGPRTPAATLVIPLVVSLTGTLQEAGAEQLRGALVAQQQLNSLGGIAGKPVEIRVLDDASDPARAPALAAELAAIGSPIALGPTGSPAAAALRAAAPGQLFVSASATSPVLDVSEAGTAPGESLFFRTAPSDTLQAKGLALLALFGDRTPTASSCSTLAIVNSDDDYGRPIADRVEQLFRQASRQISKRTPIPGVAQSPEFYDGIAASVAAAEQSCLLTIAPGEIGAEFMRSFRRYISQNPGRDWSTFQMYGSDSLYSDGFLKASRRDPADPESPSIAEGVQALASEGEPEGPNFSAYSTLYRAQFPGDPIGRSARMYDAAIVTALALDATGGAGDVATARTALLASSKLGAAYGPAKLGDLLLDQRRGIDVDYVGASGSLDFDVNGQILADFLVWRVTEGRYEYRARFTRAELQ